MTEKTSELWKKLKPYAVRDLAGGTTGGGNATGSEVGVHDLDGAKHTGTLSWAKVNKTGSDLVDLDTREADDLVATSGTERDVLSVTGAGVIDYETPDSDGTVANTLLRTDANGFIKIKDLEIERIGGGNPTLLFDAGIGNAAFEFDATGPELIIKANAVDFFRMNSSSQIITQSQDINTLKKIESAGYSGSAFEDMSLNFNTGVADFHTVYTNNLIAEKFVAGVKLAQIGNVTVGHSMALLSRDWVVPSKGSTATMYIKNVPGVGDGYQAFQQYDRLLINFFNIDSGYVGGQLYIRITSTITTSGDEQYFTAEYMNVSANDVGMVGQTVYAETTVVDLSANGTPNTGGYWEASTLESAISGGPFDQIVNMASPNTTTLTLTPVLRSGYVGGLGKIGGGSFSAGDIGFWFSPNISSDTEPAFYVTDASGGAAMRNINLSFNDGSSEWLRIDDSEGLTFVAPSSVTWADNTAISWEDSGGTTLASIVLQNGVGSDEFFIGLADNDTDAKVTIGVIDESAFPLLSAPSAGIEMTKDGASYYNEYTAGYHVFYGNTQIGAVGGTDYNLLVTGTLEVDGVSDFNNTTTFNAPGSSPSGSYIAMTSPGANVGLILYGSSTGLGEWSQYVDKSTGDLIFQDRTGSTYNSLVLDKGGSEVRLNAGNHKFGDSTSRFNGVWFVSEGTGNEISDFTDPTGGQIIVKEGDDSGPLEGSLISLKPLGWSRIGALAFNAYYDHNTGSPFVNANANWRFHGAQSTATRAGAFYYTGDSGAFYWTITGGSKTDDATISDWSDKMILNSDGDLTFGGDLIPGGQIGEGWNTVTYNSSYFEAHPFGPGNVQYQVFGSVVFLRGLARVKTGAGWSGNSDRTVFSLPSSVGTVAYEQIMSAPHYFNTSSGTTLEKSSYYKVLQIGAFNSGGAIQVEVRQVEMSASDWVSFDGIIIHLS